MLVVDDFEQLGTGPLNMSYFFLLPGLSTAATIILLEILKPLERQWYR
jgi:hypothetical protein